MTTPLHLDERAARRLGPDALHRARVVRGLKIARARSNFLGFVEDTTPGYLTGWCHRDLARRLQRFSDAVARKESPRILVTMPPRAGKSRQCSEELPVWHLGRHPTDEVVVASYNLQAARRRTRQAREVAQSEFAREVFGPALELSRDTVAKADWRVVAGGGVMAAGAGTGLTSFGANVLVIDDPFKGAEDALSPGARDRIWDWYRSVAYTRLAPGGGILVVMTPWHEDDLVGRLREHAASEGWETVDYPAIAEKEERHEITNEVLRRPGEALHPERYPLEALERIKGAVGSYFWRALYQGRPTSEDGDVWNREWWKYYVRGRALTPGEEANGWRIRPASFDRVLITGDLTFGGKGKTASWVSLLAWGVEGDTLYLLDEARGRWSYPETRTYLVGLAQRWKPTRIIIEAAAHGHALLQEIQATPDLSHSLGCRVEGVTPKGSKLARALAAAPAIEAGRVLLPLQSKEHPWVRSFIDEVTAFPTGKHSDRVDSAGIAIRSIQQGPIALPFFASLGGAA